MKTQERVVLYSRGEAWPEVSVGIPLYNYEGYVANALDSVAAQTASDIGLVVLDDGSVDASVEVTRQWLEAHPERFSRAVLAKNVANAGLSVARNTLIDITKSPFIFFLDADNLIMPRCLNRLATALRQSKAAFAYSILAIFDGRSGLGGTNCFSRQRLAHGNYIDAMALLRRDALVRFGGYADLEYGWEDYDLWLRMCAAGAYGIQVPEILGKYRVHAASMTRMTTSHPAYVGKLMEKVRERHPWVEI